MSDHALLFSTPRRRRRPTPVASSGERDTPPAGSRLGRCPAEGGLERQQGALWPTDRRTMQTSPLGLFIQPNALTLLRPLGDTVPDGASQARPCRRSRAGGDHAAATEPCVPEQAPEAHEFVLWK
jgi:hypothetical protein